MNTPNQQPLPDLSLLDVELFASSGLFPENNEIWIHFSSNAGYFKVDRFISCLLSTKRNRDEPGDSLPAFGRGHPIWRFHVTNGLDALALYRQIKTRAFCSLEARLYIRHVEQFYGSPKGPITAERVDCLRDQSQFLGFLEALRTEGMSRKFRNQLRASDQQIVRNYRRSVNHLAELLAWHNRLVVVRLDFGYSKGASELVTEQRARSDLSRFFENGRHNKSLRAEELLGYQWKLEFGHRKGYHFHVFLFFDGALVKDAFSHGRLLGEYWKQAITEGEGHYWNVNGATNTYAREGIGEVSYHDATAIKLLIQKLAYIHKVEQYLPTKQSAHSKVFRRSNMKRHNDLKKKPGPKRTQLHVDVQMIADAVWNRLVEDHRRPAYRSERSTQASSRPSESPVTDGPVPIDYGFNPLKGGNHRPYGAYRNPSGGRSAV